MNGFANTILTLLLGWLRTFVNNIWRVLNSEDGGALYQFFTAHWKAVLLVLLVGGFVVDRVVYLIRWRPYYVWSSKLGRLRRRKSAEDEEETPEPYPEDDHQTPPYAPPAPMAPQNTHAGQAAYMPQDTRAGQAPYAPQNTRIGQAAYMPQDAAPQSPAQATVRFAPLASAAPESYVPYARPYTPTAEIEPVFDDDLGSWAEGSTLVRPAHHNPAQGMEASFGAAQPEPLAYLRDMQAGFAPPKPPEQLYAPPKAEEPVYDTPTGPVHPGLDNAAFRHSFGLEPDGSHQQWADENEAWEDGGERWSDPWNSAGSPYSATFKPYAHNGDAEGEKRARRNPFATIAKKARDLVGVEDEDHRLTIHDLQPTVDMRKAFHEPVYPKRREKDEDQ